MRRLLNASPRGLAALALVGFSLAACGDDDDDADTVPTTALTTPTAGAVTGDTTPTASEGAATEASGDESTGTEESGAGTDQGTASEDMGTGTESDSAATESDSGTETEEDEAASTGTEPAGTAEDENGTATEDEATGTEDEAEGTSTSEGTASESDGDTAQLGDSVEVGDLVITVEGVEEVTSTGGVVEPESGQRFVAIEVSIENTGSDELSLFDIFSDMRLEDSAGEEFDVDLLANALLLLEGQGILEPRLEPGSEISGMIGFQVPEDGDDLMLIIESDAGESVEIDLSEATQ
jgi:hypothetical protein